jgi:hypothetical protein
LHCRDAGAIRRIFRRSFEAAGLPYFNPHSFSNTLTLLGEKLCTTPEALKTWSQNLRHEHVLTTLTSYGAVSRESQAEILKELSENGTRTTTEPDPETARQVVAHLLKKRLDGMDKDCQREPHRFLCATTKICFWVA